MKTSAREVYESIKANPDRLQRGKIGYCIDLGNNSINPYVSITMSFYDDDEKNIKQMEEKEKQDGFMFWWSSPEGLKFQ